MHTTPLQYFTTYAQPLQHRPARCLAGGKDRGSMGMENTGKRDKCRAACAFMAQNRGNAPFLRGNGAACVCLGSFLRLTRIDFGGSIARGGRQRSVLRKQDKGQDVEKANRLPKLRKRARRGNKNRLCFPHQDNFCVCRLWPRFGPWPEYGRPRIRPSIEGIAQTVH